MRPLVYGSVCSGIESASVAWEPLGWEASFFSEIEAFPRAVLQHRFSKVPLHGDFTTIQAGDYRPIDLLVGGTPCQSFSVAGLRGGLDDDCGNLALEYLRLADRLRPRWLVWENVPGVLSSNGGRDFGSILGGMVQLGYGVAYRVLDAQHLGVPQRRRRVFVVGYLGDWRPASAVLFERHSLSGDSPPRREARKAVAGTIARGSFSGGAGGRPEGASAGHFICEVTPTIRAGGNRTGGDRPPGTDVDTVDSLIVATAFGGNNTAGAIDCATALSAHGGPHGRQDFESETFVVAPPLTSNPYGDHESREVLLVTHALRGEGFDASEDGTGRGTPIIPVCIHADAIGRSSVALTPSPDAEGRIRLRDAGAGVIEDGSAYNLMASGKPHAVAFAQNTRDEVRLQGGDGQIVGSLAAQPGMKQTTYVAEAAAFDLRGREGGAQMEGPHDTANIRAADGGSSRSYLAFSAKDYGADASDIAPTMRAMGHRGSHPNGGGQLATTTRSGVRRLTPLECERLQGFPDRWTDIPYRGKPAADGPRYKSLGNSMAVPVMRWIGQRVAAVDAIMKARRAA